MNIENLRGINEVKNYKELCRIIDVPELMGKSRQLQEQMIRRYVNYRKVENSNRLQIIEIYDTPLPAIDNRVRGNNSKYLKHMEVIIRYKLQQNPIIEKTITDLGVELGFVSRNHSLYYKNQREFFKNHKIPESYEWIPIELYSVIDVTYKSIIKTAIRNFDKIGIINLQCNRKVKKIGEKYPMPISEQEEQNMALIKSTVEIEMHGSIEEILFKKEKPKSYNMLKSTKIRKLIREKLSIVYSFEKFSMTLLDNSKTITEEDYKINVKELEEKFQERCSILLDGKIEYIERRSPWRLEKAYGIKDQFMEDLFEN